MDHIFLEETSQAAYKIKNPPVTSILGLFVTTELRVIKSFCLENLQGENPTKNIKW